jgi:hypothetical protein
MFFKLMPLQHRIIKLIADKPGRIYRSTEIKGFYQNLFILLFYKKCKSVILNQLYYKGLIELHGDVALFIGAKTVSDAKYLTIAASLTPKGIVYYKLYIEEAGPELEPAQSSQTTSRPNLSVIR